MHHSKSHLNDGLETPVLFLIFNRPELTKKVFAKIRRVKPQQLYVAGDGPRDSHPEDKLKCDETRKLVLDMIDWDCNVNTLFRDDNLGCGLAVSQAISWFFENVEMGIILEDDCFPSLSFFTFCQDLLLHFYNDESVMHICGSNFQFNKKRGDGDYYFSYYPNVWGWATWKRAWDFFDYSMNDLHVFLHEGIKSIFQTTKEIDYWTEKFIITSNGDIDTWDYQWRYSVNNNKGVVIIPNCNLIINLGFSHEATHTKSENMAYSKAKLESLNSSLKHPKRKEIDFKADTYTFYKFLRSRTTFLNRIRNFVYRIIPSATYIRLKLVFGR